MTTVDVRTLDDLLAHRFSCRGFLPEPVPMATIEDVLALAQQTASWCNTQAWQVHLVTGGALKRFGRELTEHAQSHPEQVDLGLPGPYEGVYRQRRRDTGFALYRSVGVERDDFTGRAAQAARNLVLFDAPHTLIVTSDSNHGTYGAVDCGGYVATVLLALESRGVAAIPQAAVAMYSDFVRDFLALPDDRLVVCAVSFGYADHDHPANGFRTERATLDEVLTVVDE